LASGIAKAGGAEEKRPGWRAEKGPVAKKKRRESEGKAPPAAKGPGRGNRKEENGKIETGNGTAKREPGGWNPEEGNGKRDTERGDREVVTGKK
jgi:hypothetical protein